MEPEIGHLELPCPTPANGKEKGSQRTMQDHPDRIPIEKCKHGWLYRIYSRNLNLGIYRRDDCHFVGIRHKMGRRYLFAEFHWDTGEPFGTANPLEAICECPIVNLNEYQVLEPSKELEAFWGNIVQADFGNLHPLVDLA